MPAYADDKKPGGLTDPVEILKKVDAAAKAVKAVKYDVVYEGLAAAAANTPKVEASIIASGFAGNAPEKYLVDAKIILPNATNPRRITGGTDNDMFYVVHHDTKMAYEDIDPAVMGTAAQIIARAWMIEFVHPTPFSDELNGRTRELRGSKTIDGEDCFEVHVVYAVERAPQATWYVSKKDFLPRGRIDTYMRPDGQQLVWQKTISNLVINPELDDEVFKLKLPEGYTKTDDFAPGLPR
jgi:hypothetical protein